MDAMLIDRRAILAGGLGLLSAGVAHAADGAVSALSPAELVARLSALDESLRDLAQSRPLRAFLSRHGARADLLPDAAFALLLSLAWDRLPRQTREDSMVLRFVDTHARRLAYAVYETADVLDDLSADELGSIQRALAADPDIRPRIIDAIRASQARTEIDGAGDATRVADRTLWELESRPLQPMVRRLLHQLDRVSRAHGFERRDWRAVAAQDVSDEGAEPAHPHQRDPIVAGLVVLGIGTVTTGVGLVVVLSVLAVANSADPWAGFWGSLFALLGAGVLILGLLIAVVGAIVLFVGLRQAKRRRERELESEAPDSASPPPDGDP
jgi:hypothetical protein